MRDGDLNVIAEYQYDLYGKEEKATGTFDNPFRYTGQYYDSESGMYYLRARFYDPDIRRFISEDTHWNTGNSIYGDTAYQDDEIRYPSPAAIMQSGNLYGYCSSNPVNRYDITGNNWKKFLGNIKKVLCGVSIQRAIWEIGAEKYLRKKKGYISSAWFLEHSLEQNPQNVYRDGNSRVGELVKNSSEINKVVSGLIRSNSQSGKISEQCQVTFDNGELATIFHTATITFTGIKDENGVWNIHCYLEDTYDFTEFKTAMGGKGASVNTTANDAAVISQMTGAIHKYDIYIEFWITI